MNIVAVNIVCGFCGEMARMEFREGYYFICKCEESKRTFSMCDIMHWNMVSLLTIRYFCEAVKEAMKVRDFMVKE